MKISIGMNSVVTMAVTVLVVANILGGPLGQILGQPGEVRIIAGETTNIMVGDAYVSGVIHKLSLVPISLRAVIGIFGNETNITISLHKKNAVTPVARGYELIQNSPGATNKVIVTFLPRLGEQFELTMTDAHGVVVPKTSLAETIGKSDSLKPNTPAGMARRNNYFYIPQWADLPDSHWESLDPTKYFALEKPGAYKLVFVQRIYVEDEKTCLKSITLPAVTVNVRVED